MAPQNVIIEDQLLPPLTASMLADAEPQEQVQLLGKHLYPLVQQLCPALDGKITDKWS